MSARTLDLVQGSPAWLDARRAHIGASEIGALACVSPFSGPADVWAAKVGRPSAPRRVDLARRVGHLLEGLSRELWTEHTGQPATQGPVIAEGLLLASLDHWSGVLEPVDGKVITGGNPDRQLFTDTSIPEAIALQVTQQAHLVERLTDTRLDAAHVAVIFVDRFGFEFRPYRLPLTSERRELYAELAYDQLPRWWDHYVVGRVPPPDATYQDVAAAVQLDTVIRREATDEEAALLAAWAPLEAEVTARRRALADAEAKRDAVKDPLARSLTPKFSIPGAAWRPNGKNVLLKLEK